MANSDDFRKEVQSSVHKVLSGHKTKPPGKLVAEGVVEGFKLYRSYKEEKAKEGKGEEKEQHHSRRDRSTEKHHDRSRRKHGAHSHGKHRDRSRERRQERSVSRERRRSEDRAVDPGPVMERPAGEEERYIMSGGAGPPNDQNPPYRSYSRDRHRTPSLVSHRPRVSGALRNSGDKSRQRSRSRSRSRHRNNKTPPGHAHGSQSPTRLVGPDGTPFGDLPKFKLTKGVALGFGNHVVKTYKHIKAEHDAGHRSKSIIEKKMDEIRGKKVVMVKDVAVSRYRDHKKVRKERPGKNEVRDERGDRSTRKAEEVNEGPASQTAPRGTRDVSPNPPRLNLIPPTDPSSPSQSSQVLPEALHEQAPPAVPQPQPSSLWNELGSRRLSVESYNSHTSSETSTSDSSSSEGLDSTEVSPLRSSFEEPPSPVYPMSQAFEIPARPPPPPPAVAPQQHPPPMNALLGAIQGGPKLRKVNKSEIKDNSEAKAGQPLYESTSHSRDVEERERAQEGDWSTDDEAGPRSYTAPDREFQDELVRKLDGE